MEKKSGIYEILNTVNGKRYIGSAKCFNTRWRRHRWELTKQRHNNRKLQRAWNKYGEASFKFLPILTCVATKEMLLFYEQQLLNKLKPEYNIAVRADSPTAGRKLSAAHKSKIGAAHEGKIVSLETRAKQSKAGRGRTLSDEQRIEISKFQKGRVHSPEHLANQHAGVIAYWATQPKQTPEGAREKKRIAQQRRRAAKKPSPEDVHLSRIAGQQKRRTAEAAARAN